jgi:hypothetical protein
MPSIALMQQVGRTYALSGGAEKYIENLQALNDEKKLSAEIRRLEREIKTGTVSPYLIQVLAEVDKVERKEKKAEEASASIKSLAERFKKDHYPTPGLVASVASFMPVNTSARRFPPQFQEENKIFIENAIQEIMNREHQSRLEKIVEDLRAEVAAQKQKLTDAKTLADDLRREIVETKKREEDLKGKAGDAKRREEALQTKIDEAKKQETDLKSGLDRMSAIAAIGRPILAEYFADDLNLEKLADEVRICSASHFSRLKDMAITMIQHLCEKYNYQSTLMMKDRPRTAYKEPLAGLLAVSDEKLMLRNCYKFAAIHCGYGASASLEYKSRASPHLKLFSAAQDEVVSYARGAGSSYPAAKMEKSESVLDKFFKEILIHAEEMKSEAFKQLQEQYKAIVPPLTPQEIQEMAHAAQTLRLKQSGQQQTAAARTPVA